MFLQNRAVMKAIHYYETCLSKATINEQGDKYLKEVIEMLGGSNLTTPSWNSSEYNVHKAIITAFKKFGVQPFFSLNVYSDFNNSSKRRFAVCILIVMAALAGNWDFELKKFIQYHVHIKVYNSRLKELYYTNSFRSIIVH